MILIFDGKNLVFLMFPSTSFNHFNGIQCCDSNNDHVSPEASGGRLPADPGDAAAAHRRHLTGAARGRGADGRGAGQGGGATWQRDGGHGRGVLSYFTSVLCGLDVFFFWVGCGCSMVLGGVERWLMSMLMIYQQESERERETNHRKIN